MAGAAGRMLKGRSHSTDDLSLMVNAASIESSSTFMYKGSSPYTQPQSAGGGVGVGSLAGIGVGVGEGMSPLPTGGSNNSVTLWPLVPPPLGRSGSVTINSSTFNIGSTEGTLTQSPLNSPTVFNYFFPNYKYPGTLSNSGTDSPEFQLTTDTNVANLTNSITNMFLSTNNTNANGLSSFNAGNGTVVMDIGDYMTTDSQVNNAAIPGLIDTLAYRLVGAPLEASTKTTITNFVANNTNFPMTTPTASNAQRRDRVRAIIHLIITSAEYAVQK